MHSNLGIVMVGRKAVVRVFAPVGIDACAPDRFLAQSVAPELACPFGNAASIRRQPQPPWYRDLKHCGSEPRKGSRWA
jgi:hypothetical protein